MRTARLLPLIGAALLLASTGAHAIPLLQLDIANGWYDPVNEDIVTDSNTFTLYALLNLNDPTGTGPGQGKGGFSDAYLFNDNYYISVAITPKQTDVGPGFDPGSFDFGGVSDCPLVYGAPPVETVIAHDGQDLPPHDIYETYFYESPAFKFSTLAQTTLPYNVQDNPGGLSLPPGGYTDDLMYYVAFNVDRSGLLDGYELHFDLYSKIDGNSKQYADTDVNRFAPFSHDASTNPPDHPPVPEPSTLGLLGVGLVCAGLVYRRRRVG